MHHLGRVGNLLGTEQEIFLVLGHILVEAGHALRGGRESCAGSKVQLACVDEVQHAVLDNLGINRQVLQVGIHKTCNDGVRHIAHATLEGQEVFRHAACSDLLLEEVQGESAHLLGILINGRQRAGMVCNVAGDNVENLVRGAGDIIGTHPVICLNYGNWQTIWRIKGHIHIMHALQLQRLGGVDFHDDLVSALHIGSSVAQGSGRNEIAFFSDGASLHQCHIDLAQVAATAQLRAFGKMQVEVVNGTVIDFLPQDSISLIRQTLLDAVNLSQHIIKFRAGGCTSPDVHGKRLFLHALCQCHGHSLGIGGSGETTAGHIHVGLEESCCLFCRDNL